MIIRCIHFIWNFMPFYVLIITVIPCQNILRRGCKIRMWMATSYLLECDLLTAKTTSPRCFDYDPDCNFNFTFIAYITKWFIARITWSFTTILFILNESCQNTETSHCSYTALYFIKISTCSERVYDWKCNAYKSFHLHLPPYFRY